MAIDTRLEDLRRRVSCEVIVPDDARYDADLIG